MKQDRFLLGILIGIAILVLLALLVFFLRPDGLEYGPDDTPEGVTRNFIVAVQLQDYQKAYGYLAEDDDKPSLDQFIEPFQLNYINPADSGVEIIDANISGNRASVQVSIIYNARDPFAGSYRNSDQVALVLQSGQWKIRQMPYPFWYYDWYQEPYDPFKP
jgi:hypothetical protein